MNKNDLVEKVAEASDVAKTQAARSIDVVIGAIQEAIAKGDKVTLPGFGSFDSRVRKARTARNPRTGDTVKVAQTTVPVFRAGAGFKEIVSGKRKVAKSASSSPARKSPAKKGR